MLNAHTISSNSKERPIILQFFIRNAKHLSSVEGRGMGEEEKSNEKSYNRQYK